MNIEIGAEAALFPEKEYINGIFVTVHSIFSSVPYFPSPLSLSPFSFCLLFPLSPSTLSRIPYPLTKLSPFQVNPPRFTPPSLPFLLSNIKSLIGLIKLKSLLIIANKVLLRTSEVIVVFNAKHPTDWPSLSFCAHYLH
jgi:hypothetical protein